MNYIITGHRGLIGRELKKKLDAMGWKCVFTVDKRDGKELSVLKELRLDEDAEVFFHLAAHCKINQAIENPELSFENNVLGIYLALEFCRRQNIKKFVFMSSSRVLSKEKNPYTASKIYGEELIKGYCNCYGIEYVIIRPSTVYGPGEDLTNRLMNIFFTRAVAKEDLVIFGDENKTLDFTYVSDFVDGVLLTLDNGWCKEYNLSGNDEVKLKDVAGAVIKEMDSSSKIRYESPEIAQPQQVHVDISEIMKLGYAPKVDVFEGIKKVGEWFKKDTIK